MDVQHFVIFFLSYSAVLFVRSDDENTVEIRSELAQLRAEVQVWKISNVSTFLTPTL